MSWFYRHVARPLLFSMDSEVAHDLTLRALASASRWSVLCDLARSVCDVESLPVEAMGLSFPNPVGLAAGMDKLGRAVPIWDAVGFGFSELGGVTWWSQPGNPKPRMFRAVAEEGLVNRMGFNNDGAVALASRLRDWQARGVWPRHPVGVNLGKSKRTPLGEAASDYAQSFSALRMVADFFVVNVSSPNTPNLRQLQDRSALDEILSVLQERNRDGSIPPRPILVKVAPDLGFEALDEVVDVALRRNLAGIVATNTTVQRPVSKDPVSTRIYRETGGLSGRPLRQRSTEVVRHLYRQSEGRLLIVGVGGISTADDAWEKITAGASLVQVYSGLVYEGPMLVRDIVAGIRDRLGSTQWNDAVGSEL